jgi:hypothetical protein
MRATPLMLDSAGPVRADASSRLAVATRPADAPDGGGVMRHRDFARIR